MAVAGVFRAPASYPRHLPPISATHFILHCTDTRNPKARDRSFTATPSSPLRRFPIPISRSIRTTHFPLTSSSRTSVRRFFCSQTLSADTEFGMEVGEEVRKFKKRLRIVDLKGGPDEGLGRVGQTITIRGWVRTCRIQSSVTFIEVNDGSCLSNMQCVINSTSEGYNEVESGSVGIGASVLIEGTLVRSEGSKQKVELKVARLATIGTSDPSAYPIQKKRASREFLRTIAHLRPRTNTFSAVTRVRNALAYATHQFFQENGFVWISTPIITASDCEGAGEQFRVTTLIPSTREGDNIPVDLVPTTRNGTIDWSQDFFGKPAFLTVSGQLNAEVYASALSDVYTFGPTFRAENSNTSRHLAEFWMIEPELAFADLNDDMACATAYLQ
ncbi:hypothetical protein KSP40_PGU015739 [Platanthera guangdongensis]|uniref:Aminoacyl-transfer RNA synthetases class-II family profile domain-containing protein n=1 Tax=Platanthera guangdongensis TaxID=2320717 RepID=A0ABR2MLX4_9ASPA